MRKSSVETAFEQWLKTKDSTGLTVFERCTQFLITPTEVGLITESLRLGFVSGWNRAKGYNNSPMETHCE